MTGIIVMGHGTFASGICNSVMMIAGKQNHLTWIDFQGQEDLQDLCDKIDFTIHDMKIDHVLIVCDVMYGTPCKAALLYAYDQPWVKVIAGMNLSLLIQLCIEMDHTDLSQELIQKTIEDAKNAMMMVQLT